MTDREMLELAALAAWYCVARQSDDGTALLLEGVQRAWNPLEDDGDALRLATRVRLLIEVSDWGAMAAAETMDPSYAYVDGRSVGVPAGDEDAATRRAITRAAAEIGKGMRIGNA